MDFGTICIIILIIVVSKVLFDLRLQIEVLKNNLTNATRRLDELKDEAARTGTTVAEIVNEDKNTETKLYEVSEQLQQLANNVEDEKRSHQKRQPIAFSVWKRDKSTFDVVVFGEIILNQGDGYDSSTGYFTAPVRGVYSFSAQVTVSASEVITCSIMKGRAEVLGLSAIYVNTWQCLTIRAVCALNYGDRVHVRLPNTDCYIREDSSDERNSFAGFLVQRF